MIRKHLIGAAVSAIVFGVVSLQVAHAADAAALPAIGCEASDKIDGSTAANAVKQMNAAGYTQVTEIKKGCDSWWHGMAVKDGNATHVSLSPQGEVRSEGN